MKTRPVIAIAAALLLSACAAGHKGGAPAGSEITVPVDTATPSQAADTPSAEAQQAPASQDVQESVRPKPELAPEPQALLGLTAQGVDKLLGNPHLVRRDGPAEIRLYRDAGQKCTLHVFLYASTAAAADHAVEHYEVRNAQGRLNDTDAARCYGALLQPAGTS